MRVYLPQGYVARPATVKDAEALVHLFNLCSRELIGVELHGRQEQIADWGTPGFALDTDAVVVTSPDGDLVGYSEVWDFEEPHVRVGCWGRVHPEHRGLGVGAWLLEWQEKRARQAIARAPDKARVALRQSVFEQDRAAHLLLSREGFSQVRHFWRMETALDGPIPEPEWPEGVRVRTFQPDRDLERTVRTVREAFRDHWGFVSSPYEQELELWRHWTREADFDPTLWFLANAGDETAGVALCWGKSIEDPRLGYVNTVGVVRAWRRRGLGLALLRHAFLEFRRRGKQRVGLGVDATSLTGAHRLYERAGMSPKRRMDLFEKELKPGRDLMTRELDCPR